MRERELCEHLDQEVNRKKKAKTEETNRGSKTNRGSSQAAASSSGGGGAEVQRSVGEVPLEPTNKWKASEDQQEQPENKNKIEQKERGLKRSTDDWEEFAKKLRTDTERRAEENKKAKVGKDLDNDAMMEAIGSLGFTASDLNYDEAVEKFINQLREEKRWTAS